MPNEKPCSSYKEYQLIGDQWYTAKNNICFRCGWHRKDHKVNKASDKYNKKVN